MERPAPIPYKAEEGKAQVLSTNRSVRPAAMRPAFKSRKKSIKEANGGWLPEPQEI